MSARERDQESEVSCVVAAKESCDLILRSRAKHGVSKDGRESMPGNILRDAR